ncbi:glycosyltransferase [Leeuwenhoekiella aestuarii]|uniref:Glycosyltransferase involved in cell wall biosynthesis n=1 Tax=Leeuwenhoekiella aestuarii TaxID=2249426 RepID=A0A4Q0NQT6_9FLAO|nr:glycosyltransferase [Leeuwenhoekiella aestuarii]RXG13099.1 glycosyltransferase involved in cell wall biosynthesis [Leeuwenhoekiella aestuarii]
MKNKLKILLVYRHKSIGFSIERVFSTLSEELGKHLVVEEFVVPRKGSMPWDVIINNFFTFNNRNNATIYHITGHVHDVLLSLIGLKSLLTIHDLVFLDNVRNPFIKAYKWLFWFYLPIKISNRVVCISNQTRNNILKRLKTRKLVVIHNPIDPMFYFSEKEFNSDKPIILHIGTGWNKNLSRTIQALENIPCHLRIIGHLGETQLRELEDSSLDFSNSVGLTNLEIQNEYLKCDIVNFPSIYEGFGMPIIEAHKTGRVVLTSNIEPLIEVSNNAAEMVDPYSVFSLKNGYQKIINDKNYRDNLIYKGQLNAERFSVQKIAKDYLDVYNLIR